MAVLLKQKDERYASAQPLSVAILTPSEKKILRLIADGFPARRWGEVLSIHYRAVEDHRTNMYRKPNTEGANALALFELQHQI
jgi:DNA-binding CsgD family transcriptional regulator